MAAQIESNTEGTSTLFLSQKDQNSQDGNEDWIPARRGHKGSKCSVTEEAWTCDTCNTSFTDKKSKLMECEYCQTIGCTKCLKISDAVYKGLSGRPDFPFLCNTCIPKAMKLLREEREIEKRCNDFLQGFRQEVDSKLNFMSSQIEGIKEQMKSSAQNPQAQTTEVVKEACFNMSDKIAREKNIIMFNLPESVGTIEENIAKDKEQVQEINKITAELDNPEIKIRRLGKKGEKPRPLLVSFSEMGDKEKVMGNLTKMKHAKEPLNKVSVKHDLTKIEREEEKKLLAEAKTMNALEEDPTVKYIVRGMPWDRKIIKVKKKEDTATPPAKS